MTIRLKVLLASSVVALMMSCTSSEFVPKPKGYNHIELPEHKYKELQVASPFTFEQAVIAQVDKDTTNWKEQKENYRIIKYPTLGSKIHVTYKRIDDSENTLKSLVDESYRLAYGHDKKATSIEDQVLVTTSGNVATVFKLEGDVPSQYQFFAHDSTTNFMRGALYFDTALKNDSLEPIIDYMKEDIHHLLNTLEWQN